MNRSKLPPLSVPAAAGLPHAQILALAADAIICVDRQQKIIFFNRGAENTFGYKAEEVVGQPLELLIPERHRSRHAVHFAGFSAAPPTARHMGERSAISALRKSGKEFPAEATISKISHGDDFALTVVLRDTTDRMHAEASRRRDAEKLRQALAAGRLGAFEHDLATKRIKYFGHAPVILGLQATDVAVEVALSLVHPDDLEAVRQSLSGMPSESQSEMEYRVIRPDGTTVWLRAVSSMLIDAGGSRQVIGTLQDVTAWKAIEHELEQRVAERTQELRREITRREAMQDSLAHAQKMEAFGQLTGGIAHDFNNLLTVIGGNLELLEMRVPDERAQRQLKRAIDAVRMGAQLTEHLLTFARRRKLTPESLRVNALVTDMIDLLRRTLGEDVTITSTLAPDLAAAHADQGELESAILNLAINARDAMPHGGRLVIETANALVDDTIRIGRADRIPPGAYVRISVSDNGIGMTPDIAARAFEPFFTTKEHGKGTGLGLATVYGFAKQSGGGVTLYSEPGAGTTVSLYLPEYGDRDAAAARPAPRPAPATAGKRGLVVEDDPDVSDVAVQRLETLGISCVACSTAAAAIAILEKDSGFDVILSDITMPGGMSGYDLAAWVKTHRPGVAVVLATGFSGETARRAADSGEDLPMLRKPYSTQELAAAISRAVDRT